MHETEHWFVKSCPAFTRLVASRREHERTETKEGDGAERRENCGMQLPHALPHPREANKCFSLLLLFKLTFWEPRVNFNKPRMHMMVNEMLHLLHPMCFHKCLEQLKTFYALMKSQ
jgi:hypothetical protein